MTKSLSSDSSDEALANRFSNFFSDKIKRINDILLATPNSDAVDFIDSSFCNSSFSEFSTMSEEVVRDIIMKSHSSTCSLDPIPYMVAQEMCKRIAADHLLGI